jgi:hypothetical protein
MPNGFQAGSAYVELVTAGSLIYGEVLKIRVRSEHERNPHRDNRTRG